VRCDGRAGQPVDHGHAVRVHGVPRRREPDWRDRQPHHRALRLHRGDARGREAARRSAARRGHRPAAAGAHHGGGDGHRALPARRARRTAVGADVLHADWWPHHRHLRHAPGRAGDLRDVRAGSQAGEVGDGEVTSDWQRWGTYVSERAWGTVREDYSADGSAWEYFPHDHARSRAYRWCEDGLAGFCDRQQHLSMAVALWNERDPILKERMFGLSNREGNHGEDVKEYYFYLDNTPTHSYATLLYKYPQVAFPYDELVAENLRRGPHDPEHELVDAIGDVFREGRYFDVFVEYAKLTPEDILCRIRIVNRGPEAAPIHVLPHLWYRNTWSWRHGAPRHVIHAARNGAARTSHPELGARWWYVRAADGARFDLLFTENDTNAERLFGERNRSKYVKDGINEAVVHGRRDTVNREGGSKAAAHLRAMVAPGETFEVQVRLSPERKTKPFAGFTAAFARRRREADQFYDDVHDPRLDLDARLVQRQAFAGLLWSKQFYHYDVHHWLRGDPAQPPPPPERWQGRNHDWALHFQNADIVLMPDKWEYPWYASWDLAFQAVVMAEIDAEFAKAQMKLLTLPRSQHPYGAIPAFEWDFNAVNPPVVAWAVWQIYQLDRRRQGVAALAFLEAVFDPLVMALAWW